MASSATENEIVLSLISHTNVGKTALARTLLREDVGEVADSAHVTIVPEAFPLIEKGDLIATRDSCLKPIKWIGQRAVPGRGNLAPISFEAGALQDATAPLLVSPQHRMLFTGYEAELLFGEGEVLIHAKFLINGSTVRQNLCEEVTYIHIMFDDHEIIYANGQATESFHADDAGLSAIADESREELFSIFPELRWNTGGHGDTARICLKAHEAKLIAGGAMH